jgi:hypothetical protein
MSPVIQTPRTYPKQSEAAECRYVYLCSPAHSGSTLIACLAAAHPSLATVGEFCIPQIKTELCSCNRPYTACPFWQEWVQIANHLGIDFTPDSMNRWIGQRTGESLLDSIFYRAHRYHVLNRIRDIAFSRSSKQQVAETKTEGLVRIAQLLCQQRGASAFVDTSKNSACVRFLLKQEKMPLWTIYLVRDGRGTVCSLMKWYGKSLRAAVDQWKHSVCQTQRVLHYVPANRVLHLRYEDLATDPETHIHEFYSFCGVDPHLELDFSSEKRHVVGNAMRHTFDGNIRLDESWRQRLTKANLKYFDAHAGLLNRSLGYFD